jgi:hypothetical protein
VTSRVFGSSDGVIAAVVATMLYALAVVLQKAEAERVTTHGLRILGSLAKLVPSGGWIPPTAMAQAVYGQDVRVGSSKALAAFATAAGLVTLCTSQRASGRSLG